MTILWSIAGFVIAMGLLVAIHEWGHYIVAKKFNIKVLQFSIGFGRAFYQKQVGETEYRLAMIPLGGYVKFVDEREGDVAPEDLPRAFNRQSVYKRFAVVAAGPLINLVFAWLVFSAIYLFGAPGIKPVFDGAKSTGALEVVMQSNHQAWQILEVDGKPVSTWRQVHHQLLSALIAKQEQTHFRIASFGVDGQLSDQQNIWLPLTDLNLDNPKENWFALLGFSAKTPTVPPKLNQIVEGSAADQAGFQTGDLILAFNGQKMSSWEQFVEAVQNHPSQMVQLSFQRDGVIFERNVRLETAEVQGKQQGRFGASVLIDDNLIEAYRVNVQYPFFESLQKGIEHSLDLIDMSLTMLKRMLFGEASIKNLSGPISIADFSGQALQSGWVSFLSLLGLLSLSLGILNLLPIPLLDGGHLFFYLVEMIKGSPLNEKLEGFAQRVGLLIILSLTFLAVFNDIIRISDG